MCGYFDRYFKTYSIKNKNDMNSRILLLPFLVFHTTDFIANSSSTYVSIYQAAYYQL